MDKISQLYKYLEDLGEICIGFSGGVDSTFLTLAASKALGDKAICVTARSPFITEGELSFATEFAKKLGIRHEIVDILPDEVVLSNTKDRCYYCKRITFSEIVRVAKENEIAYVADGANVDDLDDYRPGTRATAELKIKSPLKDLGFTKADIRENLERLIKENKELSGYDIYKKPAMACLASRIPYGTRITEEILLLVGEAEKYLRSEYKLDELRVRYHNDVARIEVLPKDFERITKNAEAISSKLKSLGFLYITLDIDGIRRGSLNEVLDLGEKK